MIQPDASSRNNGYYLGESSTVKSFSPENIVHDPSNLLEKQEDQYEVQETSKQIQPSDERISDGFLESHPSPSRSLPTTIDISDHVLQAHDTNKKLLTVAFYSFLAFTIVQCIAAYIAESEAMMGDSIAMFVDAFTYAMNLLAERMKMDAGRSEEVSTVKTSNQATLISPCEVHAQQITRTRSVRKKILLLELIPPALSVTTLVVVTIIVTHKSVESLQRSRTSFVGEEMHPNAVIMAIFSILNLLLDLVNMLWFAGLHFFLCFSWGQSPTSRIQDASYESVNFCKDKTDNSNKQYAYSTSLLIVKDERSDLKSSTGHEHLDPEIDTISHVHIIQHDTTKDKVVSYDQLSGNLPSHDVQIAERNLNMFSAYTHVLADTLRSVAVLVAAIVAQFSTRVTPQYADAIAAIVVSLIIFIALFPLVRGLHDTWLKLKQILMEERIEKRRAYSSRNGYDYVNESAHFIPKK